MSAQADLLGYFGQQLIAHGATLFAVLTAALTFIGWMRPRVPILWKVLVHVGMAAVLLAVTIYTLFRMIYYGVLVSYVIETVPDCGSTLSEYLRKVSDATNSSLIQAGWGFFGWWFVAVFRSLNLFILVACYLMGFLIALTVYLVVDRDGYTLSAPRGFRVIPNRFLWKVWGVALVFALVLASWGVYWGVFLKQVYP